MTKFTSGNPGIICFFKYGDEDKTFLECRKNWEFYLSQHQDIHCLFFRGDPTISSGEPLFNGYDYMIGEAGRAHPRPTESTYSKNTTWSHLELWHGMQSWIQAFNFVVNNYPTAWIVWVNITAFISFQALKYLVNFFPKKLVYGGWPHLYNPERFLYHSGSSVIFSPDVARLLANRIAGYQGIESIDILWGRLLLDVPRTIIPFLQITPEYFPDKNLRARLDRIAEALEKGHYFFRIKNHGMDVPRYLLDPTLQSFLMARSLMLEPQMADRYLALTLEARDDVINGRGLTVIG